MLNKYKFLWLVVFLLIISDFGYLIAQGQLRKKETGFSYILISPADSANSIKALNRDINRILSSNNLNNSKYSVAVFSLDNNKYLYKKNIEDLLTPASTTKFVTCFVALFTMGADFPVKTTVYTDGTVDNGVVNGNLYIMGHGDALLSVSDVEYLADQLRKQGIKEVTGNVYGDGSYFDDVTERIAYSGDKDLVQSTQPITALSIESNVATVLISSGAYSGRMANVQIIPASDAFKIANKTKVSGGTQFVPQQPGKKKSRSDIFQPDNQQLLGIEKLFPADEQLFGDPSPERSSRRGHGSGSGISFTSVLQNDGNQIFSVSGVMEANKTQSYRYYIMKPNLAVAGTLRNRLISGGINVKGVIGEKSLYESGKKNPRQLAEFSRPLIDIMYPMIKTSDNYLAETVYKIIGAHSGKLKSNSKEARQIIAKVIDSLDIPCADCQFNDGSGLSRRNSVNAQSFIKMLKYTTKLPFGKKYDSTLSIAGVDGTLKNRMLSSLAENNLHGKTGTHSNVSALVGYVNTLDGEHLAFAFMFNGSGVGVYKNVEDEIGKLLAQFFYFNEEE